MREPKIGEKIHIADIPQYAPPDGKPCKVEVYALGVAFVRPLRWRGELLEVPLEKIVYIEPEKLSTAEKKEIIRRFVLEEYLPDYKIMARELGVLNQLIDRYPNLTFWRETDFGFQAKSFSWWLGGGEKDLRVLYNKFTLFNLDESTTNNDNNGIKLESEKIGEDLNIQKRAKNLLDLL